jgi:hypothetical protein
MSGIGTLILGLHYALSPEEWAVVEVCDTSRGMLKRMAYSRYVYMWDDEMEITHRLRKVVSQSLRGEDVKISLAKTP